MCDFTISIKVVAFVSLLTGVALAVGVFFILIWEDDIRTEINKQLNETNTRKLLIQAALEFPAIEPRRLSINFNKDEPKQVHQEVHDAPEDYSLERTERRFRRSVTEPSWSKEINNNNLKTLPIDSATTEEDIFLDLDDDEESSTIRTSTTDYKSKLRHVVKQDIDLLRKQKMERERIIFREDPWETTRNYNFRPTTTTELSSATEVPLTSTTAEVTLISTTADLSSILELTEEPPISRITDGYLNFELTEEPSISRTTEDPSISRTTEDPSISRTTEGPSILELSEEPSNSRTSRRPSIFEITEEPSISRTTEGPLIFEITRKSLISTTQIPPIQSTKIVPAGSWNQIIDKDSIRASFSRKSMKFENPVEIDRSKKDLIDSDTLLDHLEKDWKLRIQPVLFYVVGASGLAALLLMLISSIMLCASDKNCRAYSKHWIGGHFFIGVMIIVCLVIMVAVCERFDKEMIPTMEMRSRMEASLVQVIGDAKKVCVLFYIVEGTAVGLIVSIIITTVILLTCCFQQDVYASAKERDRLLEEQKRIEERYF